MILNMPPRHWRIAGRSSPRAGCATITARNVAFDELFQCRVVSEIPDAIDVPKAIEAERGGPSARQAQASNLLD